jgi:choline kinase
MTGGVTHVVVLAAGKGTRLGEVGAERPKWLLEIGGQTIADRQLAAVEWARREAGGDIGEVTIVTGHAAREIDRFIAEQNGTGAAALHNPLYAEANNWYSVLLALREVPNHAEARVVIVNGDLYAAPPWIGAFLAESARAEADSLIGIDLGRELTAESMKVSLDAADPTLVRGIGKVGIDPAAGEYVGLLMARGPVLRAFRETLEAFVGVESSRDEWYERAVGLTAGRGVPWTVWPTPDSDWVEIDDDQDLSQARELAQGASA